MTIIYIETHLQKTVNHRHQLKDSGSHEALKDH